MAGTPMWKATRLSTVRALSPSTPVRPTIAHRNDNAMTAKA